MIIAITCGHGGQLFGRYLTRGKKSPDGRLLEGAFTRELSKRLTTRLGALGLPSVILNPGPVEVPPVVRRKMVEALCACFSDKRIVQLELHTNAAAAPGWSKARGHRVFPVEMSGPSLALAKQLDRHFRECVYPGLILPNSTVRLRKLAALSKTAYASVLLEIGFHNNLEDVALLLSNKIRQVKKAIEESINDLQSQVEN